MSDPSANRRESSARLKRNVTKFAFRGREKMLRSFGRGEETKDEIIDNYVYLVTKQQVQFQKFQHDMKRYLQSIIVMKMAAADFYASLGEIYEDDWMGKDMVGTLAKATDLLYTDLHARLNTEVITVLQDHLNQCNEMKVKVNKRGRKLVDFDASRRALAGLQTAKKLEESKLGKAQDHVTQAHDTYETLNSQLHDDLPDLYDSRVTLCTDLISNISTAEKAFYDELSDVRTKMKHVVTNVRDAFDNGEYRIQRLHSPMRNEHSPKLPEPSTLPADEVTGQRSRGHSERSSGDRRHSGSPHKHNSSHRSSKHDDSSRRKRSSSNRSDHDASTHQYVNIQVGQQSDHVTNGPDQSEEMKTGKTPEPVQEAEKVRKPEPQTKSLVAEKPRPSPRLKVRDVPHDRASTSTNESTEGAPHPRPRTMTLPDSSEQSEMQNQAKKKSKTLDKKTQEDPVKRKSLLTFTGLDKLFTKSPKRKTPSESTEEKNKGGFFGLKAKEGKSTTKEAPKAHRNPPSIPPSSPQTPSDPQTSSVPVFQKVQAPDFKQADDDSPTSEVDHSQNFDPVPQFQSAGGATEHQNYVNMELKSERDDGSESAVYENVNNGGVSDDVASSVSNLYEDVEVPDDVISTDDDVINHDSSKHDDVIKDVSLSAGSSISRQSTPFGSEENVFHENRGISSVVDGNGEGFNSMQRFNDDFADFGNFIESSHNEAEVGLVGRNSPQLVDEIPDSGSNFNQRKTNKLTSGKDHDITDEQTSNLHQDVDFSHQFEEEDPYEFARNIVPLNTNETNNDDVITGNVAAEPKSHDVISNDVTSSNDISFHANNDITNSFSQHEINGGHDVILGDATDNNDSSGHDVISDYVDTAQKKKLTVDVDDIINVEENLIVTSQSSTSDDSMEILEEPQQMNGGSPVYDTVPSEIEEKIPEKETKPEVKVLEKNAENVILPPHYLYTVQAQYQYQGADEDELTFGKGDIIYVVEFPDPDEQDDGWQMGIPRSSWEDTGSTSAMGVFPENFTKKV